MLRFFGVQSAENNSECLAIGRPSISYPHTPSKAGDITEEGAERVWKGTTQRCPLDMKTVAHKKSQKHWRPAQDPVS